MRRSLAPRIAIMVFVALTAVAPMSAAPRDDSPIGPAGRVLKRVFIMIRTNVIRAFNSVDVPKP
jgi:hypothetical protein